MEHLKEINEKYANHFIFAIKITGEAFILALKGLCHAIYPNCFSHCFSNFIEKHKQILENK